MYLFLWLVTGVSPQLERTGEIEVTVVFTLLTNIYLMGRQ
jgi:hypothetical protein